MSDSNAVAIIQARMGSSRLPGKIFKQLAGTSALEWIVDAAQVIPGIDQVVVATTQTPADDPVVDWCQHKGVASYRGPEDDVLARYAGAGQGADWIMRLTADCPFLDPDVAGQVLYLARKSGVETASNHNPPTWPDGLDCEVVSYRALEAAHGEATLPGDREHVMPFIRRNRYRFPSRNLHCPIPGMASERWTLDTVEDLVFLQAVAAHLPRDRSPRFSDILEVVECTPEIARLRPRGERNEGAMESLRADQLERMAQPKEFSASNALLERARTTIPLGSQTFSKSYTQFPQGHSPLFLTHGQGGRVWDPDGNEYVDLISALLPVVLGYGDPDVDEAIRAQLDKGISFSLASPLEAELAESLTEIIPCAEMVRFGKNGTDATSAAIRLARAYTGRDRVVAMGYHGWQDWYIGATTRNKGVPESVSALTHKVPFNDVEAVKDVLQSYPGEVAAVILEPVGAQEPKPGYLEALQELTHEAGAVLIFDEIITGFRVALGGAQAHYGVTPDLAAFGKAMGNGMPISAVVGRADIMREMEEIFFSGTFGGETLSIAAAIAVIDKMRREPVIEKLWDSGQRVGAFLEQAAQRHGLERVFRPSGLPPWQVITISEHEQASVPAIKTLFLKEMLAREVLVAGSLNVCWAHEETDLAQVEGALEQTLSRVYQEIECGALDDRLDVPLVQPVFQPRAIGYRRRP